ncbi:MAG: GNAT family N-acetyltransferase [Saprospiraceae bacterium]|nr:GNAT family N-acetyltransferase [Saprospiraceae bacterium]
MQFILRPWREEDIPHLVKYANNQKIADRLTDKFPYPYTESEASSFINAVKKQDPITLFAIEVNQEAAGSIGIIIQEDIWCKNAELGYWLAEHLWGKGIITAAIKQIVDFGFKNFEIDRIFARPFGSNKASQRVLEKAGFQLEARLKHTIFKNGRYEDEMIYGIRRDT